MKMIYRWLRNLLRSKSSSSKSFDLELQKILLDQHIKSLPHGVYRLNYLSRYSEDAVDYHVGDNISTAPDGTSPGTVYVDIVQPAVYVCTAILSDGRCSYTETLNVVVTDDVRIILDVSEIDNTGTPVHGEWWK